MAQNRSTGRWQSARRKPLQAGKFVGILLALVLGAAGFFRLIDASTVTGEPVFWDPQLLAILLLPLLALGLVVVVFLETLVSVYRLLRSDRSVEYWLGERPGYVAVRVVEAVVAIAGVVLVAVAIPPLVSESTPAPAGVALMLFVMAVGIAILVVSFVRASLELFVYRSVE